MCAMSRTARWWCFPKRVRSHSGRSRRCGRAGGDRLCPGGRHSLRAGHHPQPLCGPHLYRADPVDPRTRRAPQAQRQPLGRRRQAHRADRRQPGARHHVGEDRAHDARGRRCGGTFPHRLAADHPSGFLRHRHPGAGQAARRQSHCRRDVRDHRRRLARLPVCRRHLPRHGRGAPRSAAPAIHRPLLHRRLSDPAHRPRRHRAATAFAVGGGELTAGVLSDRIALVTGASRGIGAATALAIRKAGGSATLVPLDVTDFEGLARLAVALNERYGRLDILIGNAGIAGPCSPLDHLILKDWDEVMKVNVTANWQLICAMDALLRRSDAGRAVFLTSGAAHHLRPYWGLYATSKAALEAVVRTYAAETERTAVRVNLINPGPTRTRMRAQVMPGEDPMTLPPPEEVAEKIVELCMPGFSETGRIYDFPTRKLMSFRAPG